MVERSPTPRPEEYCPDGSDDLLYGPVFWPVSLPRIRKSWWDDCCKDLVHPLTSFVYRLLSPIPLHCWNEVVFWCSVRQFQASFGRCEIQLITVGGASNVLAGTGAGKDYSFGPSDHSLRY